MALLSCVHKAHPTDEGVYCKHADLLTVSFLLSDLQAGSITKLSSPSQFTYLSVEGEFWSNRVEANG